MKIYIICLLAFCGSVFAGVTDTSLVTSPSSIQFNGYIGAVFHDSIVVRNTTSGAISVTVAESSASTSLFASSRMLKSKYSGWNQQLQPVIQKLKYQLQGKSIGNMVQSQHTGDALAYTTIVNDTRGDTTFGSIDVYRIDYQRRTVPVLGAYYDFKIITNLLPDSNVAGILSVDRDQEFGTGLFPTPAGFGLTSRDLGSEFEILLDASGIIAETLGLGNIPIGVIFNSADTSIVGIPLPLTLSRDSVFTITFSNVLASWFGDSDNNMNIGGVFFRIGSNLNPYPDFAPEVSHGTIGVEKPVSWIEEDTTSFSIPANDSVVLRLRALAANPEGTYTKILKITPSGGARIDVPVTLTTMTTPPPHIGIMQWNFVDSLAAGDTSNQTLKIINSGEGMLGYAIFDTGNATWLGIRSQFGTIQPFDSALVTIHFSTSGLTSEQMYSTLLRLYSNDPDSGMIPIQVSLFVKMPPYPVLYVHPTTIIDTIHFGDSAIYSISIENNGGEALTYTIADTASNSWLTFDVAGGTLAPGDDTTVTVHVHTSGLNAGQIYVARLHISSNDTANPVETVSLYIQVRNGAVFVIEEGWNLLSLPVELESMALSEVFPTAVSQSFQFDNGYLQMDTLELYKGFWLKFPEAETIELEGNPLGIDSLTVHRGWNLIGTVSDTVSVADIQTVPEGIIASYYFSFSLSEGYQQATELLPTKGYWVRTNSAGTLILNAKSKKSTMK